MQLSGSMGGTLFTPSLFFKEHCLIVSCLRAVIRAKAPPHRLRSGHPIHARGLCLSTSRIQLDLDGLAPISNPAQFEDDSWDGIEPNVAPTAELFRSTRVVLGKLGDSSIGV